MRNDLDAETISAAVNVTVGAMPRVFFIHPNHLNTPRLIADDAQKTMWRWDQQEPFGNDVPNDNPSGAGAFDFPLRFPGQYFDRETDLAYNYLRDYDPAIGRYVQSDPIGLRGGLNTYLYVGGRPISIIDFLGLDWAMFPGASEAMRPPPSSRKVSTQCFFICVIAKTVLGIVRASHAGGQAPMDNPCPKRTMFDVAAACR